MSGPRARASGLKGPDKKITGRELTSPVRVWKKENVTLAYRLWSSNTKPRTAPTTAASALGAALSTETRIRAARIESVCLLKLVMLWRRVTTRVTVMSALTNAPEIWYRPVATLKNWGLCPLRESSDATRYTTCNTQPVSSTTYRLGTV